MSKFGWSYPAGAADDPFAPYNQEEVPDNSELEEAFSDYSGLYDIYRSVYKYGDCGATVGATIDCWYEEQHCDESGPGGGYSGVKTNTFYCDDLRQWDWKSLNESGAVVTALHVSSIVEGVDQCTDTHTVEIVFLETEAIDIREKFWKAVGRVEAEALDIWNSTHGCDTCLEHWKSEGCFHDEWGNELDWGTTPVWTECPECEGIGACI